MVGIVGFAEGMDPEGGVDVQAAAGGYLRLGLPHGGVEGVELAVDVGGAEGVPVYQGQLSYAGAGQGLHGIAAHAAQTEHRHMAAGQAVHGVIA